MRGHRKLFALSLFLLANSLWATPGIERVSRASEHFILQIDESQASQLDSLIPLCEGIWNRLQAFTGYTPPGKISLVFRDEDDYANGWAAPTVEMVSIWQTPLLFEFRGGTKWLHNVLSHEIAHIFTMRAAGVDSRFLGMELIGLKEREKGFSTSGHFIYVPEDLESWFAEGLAQLGAEATGNDRFDAQRAMLERIAWHSGALPPDPLLRTFTGDSRESELVYNQGYSFARWVAQNGSYSVAKLLATAKVEGFRDAVALSFAKDFNEVFKMWRDSKLLQYGPANPDQILISPLFQAPHNLRYMAATSALRTNHSLWVVSSHDNDFGQSSLWKISNGSPKRIFREAFGRIRISADKSKILAIREQMGLNRRVIRDAVLVDELTGSVQALTDKLRVQDVDFLTADSYIAVVRIDGSNVVVKLDSRGKIVEHLPLITDGDVIQVAAQSSLDGNTKIFAVAMGSQGFKLLQFHHGVWVPMFSDSVERRDMISLPDGLFYSCLHNGIWQIAKQSPDGKETIVSAVQGGAFAANFDEQGDFLYSNYGANGFLISEGSLRSDSLNPPISPTPVSVSPDSFPPNPKNPPFQKRNSTNDFYYLGYQLLFGFADFGVPEDSVMSLGKKWLVGGGMYWSNANMETIASLSFQGMKGAMESKADWDPGVSLQISSEAWSPLLTLALDYSEVTPDYVPDYIQDSLDINALPIIVRKSVSIEAVQPFNAHWGALATLAYQTLGLSLQGYADGYSLDIIKVWQGVTGLYADYQSSGVNGALSGWSSQIIGRRVIPTIGNSFSSDEEVSTDALSYWSLEGALDLRTHYRRSLLLGQTWQGMMDFTSNDHEWLYSVRNEMGIPLGHWYLSVGKNRRLTWLDPELWVSHTLMPLESSQSSSDILAGSNLRSAQFMRDPAWSEARDLHQAAWKLSNFQKRSLSHDVSIDLYLKSVSLWNARSYWKIGASRQWLPHEGWQHLCYQVSIVL